MQSRESIEYADRGHKTEKYITDERTELKYELVGDYHLISGKDEPEEEQEPVRI